MTVGRARRGMSLRPRPRGALPSAAPQRPRLALVLHAGAQTGAWMRGHPVQPGAFTPEQIDLFFRLLNFHNGYNVPRNRYSEALRTLMTGKVDDHDLVRISTDVRRFYRDVIIHELATQFKELLPFNELADNGITGNGEINYAHIMSELTAMMNWWNSQMQRWTVHDSNPDPTLDYGERQEFFELLASVMNRPLTRTAGSNAFDRLMQGKMKAGDLFDVEVLARRFYKAVILPLLPGDFEQNYMTSERGLNGRKNLFLESVHQEIFAIIAFLKAERSKLAGKGKGGGGGGRSKGRGRGSLSHGRVYSR